ncbi:hypothetical protein ACH5RR_035983 [Cinchona calisaya]|uniref:Cytochrome P450 n=1 Tax=Cinchona calisaya TaxID=153742 RepID=A0ABD2Y5G2_9GENT
MKYNSMSRPMDLSHDLFPRVHPHIHAWMDVYGKNFLLWVGHKPQLIVTEPELIREILSNKDHAYPKMKVDTFAKKLIGDGLVMTEGEKWVKLRKLANQAFHAESLKDMVPAMIDSVETKLEKWRNNEEGKEIDVYEEFRHLTSEVISRTAFGSSYLEGKNIFEMLTLLGFFIFKNDSKIRFFKDRKYFRSADEIESDKIEKLLRETIMSIVKKREDGVKMGKTESYGSDFLGSLLKVHHDADIRNRITVDDVVDECKTFYLAGHETISSALTWTVFLLAIHSDWQDKARKEVIELFGQEKPKPECISKLRNITMIINETLRLYSPVTSLVRRVERQVKLGKITLPANMDVHIPIYALHCDQEVWGKDALSFKPERFAEGVAKATNYNTMAFLPFGFGPRTCVGLNFATNEVKIALSMILQRFRFTLSPNYVHSPFPVLTLRPQQGLLVLFDPL